MEKSKIQETIQNSFEQECRGYAFYLEAYNLILAQIECCEDEMLSLQEEVATFDSVSKLEDYFNSKKFERIKEKLKISDEILPDKVAEFTKNNKINMEEADLKIKKLDKQEKELCYLLKNKKDTLERIKNNLLNILSYISEQNMKIFVPEDVAKVAYKVLVSYYMDTMHFDGERNILIIEKSFLPEDFLKAYMAGTSGDEADEALKWFEEKAKKIKWFE